MNTLAIYARPHSDVSRMFSLGTIKRSVAASDVARDIAYAISRKEPIVINCEGSKFAMIIDPTHFASISIVNVTKHENETE